jgi:1,4-alpha-glucan branching enzyme
MPSKKYSKKGQSCQVTFVLPASVGAEQVALCGDFNQWSPLTHPMRRNGTRFEATLRLNPGESYRYRFLLDGSRWENDWAADRYEPNGHGTENSVIDV